MAKIQPKVQGDERDNGLRGKMIAVNRVTKVVKGGRILGFVTLIVVGDGDGHTGMGRGKAKGVPMVVQEVMDEVRCKIVKVLLKNGTLQHGVAGKRGTAKVQMIPVEDGTGVIADGPICAVFEVMGMTSIATRSYSSTNPCNVVRAALDGLCRMSTPAEAAVKRGRSVREIPG